MKKILNFLFIVIMIFAFSTFVKAADNRTEITDIEVSSNVNSIAVYNGTIGNPTFNVTNGYDIQFLTEGNNWSRHNGEKWLVRENGYKYNSGSWHYRIQVKIESETYRFSSQTKIYVNGEEWNFSYSSSNSGSDYSMGWLMSPTYEFAVPSELHYFEYEGYAIYFNYINTAIPQLDVSRTAEGGTEPYIFEKVSGPEWMNVSTEGIVSGTPTEAGLNPNLVVRVTDATSEYREITIPISKTILTPNLRELIPTIEATSNTSSIPVLDAKIEHPTFNITTGTQTQFVNYNSAWYKLIGSTWKEQTGNFTPGKWQYRTQIVLQGEAAEVYRLSDETTAIVDGNDWNFELSGTANEYYEGSVKSPIYTITGKISSIELDGTIKKPVVGNNIEEPLIGIISVNGNSELVNAIDVTAKWQYKTGDRFFDWADATGKFEANKTYHVRIMIEIINDVYELENIATFPVTFEGYELTQFQLNNKTVGEFIEFPESKEITIPNVSISNDNNIVTLTWDSQSAATKYEIYRSTSKTKGYKKIASSTTNTYKNSGLGYGKTYYYKVKSCDESKCTNYSNIVSKYIKPNKTTLKITSAGTNNIKIAWDKVSVSGYQIQRSTNGKKWSTVKTITKNSTLSFNNTRLSSNKKYYYRIRAYKKVGRKKIYGSWSAVVSTKTAPVKPSLKVTLKDYNAMNIAVGSSKGATKYIVERSIDGKAYTLFDEITTKATLASLDQEVGKTYYYRVRACNSENRCSSWVTKSLKQTTKVPSFTLKTTSKKVTITLTSVNGADGYQIYRATSRRGKYSLIKEFTTEDELLQCINNTTKGRTYYYKVRSYKKVNETKVYSPYSGIKYIRSK